MFSDKHVQAAIDRLPSLSTAEVKALQARGQDRGIEALVAACESELALRPIAFSASDAEAHARMADEIQDLELADTIAVAFSRVRPANEVEREMLQWVATNPGATYQQAVEMRGKGDVGLLIGHLIYDRFGCFRRFVKPGQDLSSLLLHKDRSGPSVRYRLTPEAEDGLRRAGVLAS